MSEKDKQEKKLNEQGLEKLSSPEKGADRERAVDSDQEKSFEKEVDQGFSSESFPETDLDKLVFLEGEDDQERKDDLGPTPASRTQKIEKILEKDLQEAFSSLEPEKQKEFAKKGEETAEKINELLNKGKVKTRKIIDLIKKWLSYLPGVNKFFLEKEAKKKAEEIIKLKQE